MWKFVGNSETVPVFFVDTVDDFVAPPVNARKAGCIACVIKAAKTYVRASDGSWINYIDSTDIIGG